MSRLEFAAWCSSSSAESSSSFTVDHGPPLAFWTVTWNGQAYHLPTRVTGDEQPEFFRSRADKLLGPPRPGSGYIDVAG